MASLISGSMEANATPSNPLSSTASKPDWREQIDAEQAFRLVDTILPFEACLYHQILPLCLEGSRLRLGMVDPEDTVALDYVRRILAYMNCSLVPQPLASDTHYAALSAYLNQAGQKGNLGTPTQPVARRIARKLAEDSSRRRDPNNHPTLLVDSPDQLHPDTQSTLDEARIGSHHTHAAELAATPTASPQAGESASGSPTDPVAVVPLETIPTLDVHPLYLDASISLLAKLPPEQLFHELLGRVLLEGIGRIYFEQRYPDRGRILWSQNGILQSVLEDLPITTFQAVIGMLKQLTQLPPEAVTKPQQVEIERLYRHQRVMLRLRVMPGAHGEEATAQVLRGAALKFYQQQQLATLSRETAEAAKELERKLIQLSGYTRTQPTLTTDELGLLNVLEEMLKTVEQQVGTLRARRALDV